MLKISVLFLVYFFVYVRGRGISPVSRPVRAEAWLSHGTIFPGLEQRIAGGEETTINAYPFAAALLTNRGSGTYVQACGGTILTTSAILSAASCFYTDGIVNPVSWWRARVGSSNANSAGTIYILNRITIHEDFAPTTLANDIAVLRTTLPIALQPNLVQAASISGAGYTFQNNQVVYAIGWGATSSQDSSSSEQLRVVQVWLINQQTCINRYSGSGVTITDNMLCAGWLDVGVRGQCAGDAGSPLLDANGAVIGVFSRAEGCADDWYPDINTRVSAYVPWIIAAATAN